MRYGTKLKLESLVETETNVDEMDHVTNEAEVVMQEINQLEDTITGETIAMELAEEDLSMLDQIEDKLKDDRTAEISKTYAEATSLKVESLMQRYGADCRSLATESYGTSSSSNKELLQRRVTAAKLQTEGFVASLRDSVADKVSSYLTLNGRLATYLNKAADSIDKKIGGDFKSVMMKERLIDGGNYIRQPRALLTLDGKFLGKDLNSLKKAIDVNCGMQVKNEKFADLVSEVTDAAKAGLLHEKLSESEYSKLLPSLSKISSSVVDDLGALGYKDGLIPTFGDSVYVLSKREDLSGRGALRTVVSAAMWVGLFHLVGALVFVYRENERIKDVQGKIEALDVKELKEYSKMMRGMAKSIEDGKYYGFLRNMKATSATRKSAKEVAKEIDKLEITKGNKKTIKNTLAIESTIVNNAISIRNRNIGAISRGLMHYSAMSLKNLHVRKV